MFSVIAHMCAHACVSGHSSSVVSTSGYGVEGMSSSHAKMSPLGGTAVNGSIIAWRVKGRQI